MSRVWNVLVVCMRMLSKLKGSRGKGRRWEMRMRGSSSMKQLGGMIECVSELGRQQEGEMKTRVVLIQQSLNGIDEVLIQDFNTLFKDEEARRDRPSLVYLFFVIGIPENESISV